MNKKTKYEGQALAITMVVLVVSALIGLSIYSRATKDKILTMEERMSAEALEVSDAILERLVDFPVDDVLSEMSTIATDDGGAGNIEEGITLTEPDLNGNFQITKLFRNLGVISDLQDIEDLLSPLCPLTDTGGNEYKLVIEEGENYEVRAGQVWSLPLRDLLEGTEEDCLLSLDFEVRGDTGAGFVISQIYCDYAGEGGVATSCEEYNENHITNYCFASESSGLCNNIDRFYDEGGDSNWVKFVPGVSEPITIQLKGENPPSEIRVTAVAGTIGIDYSIPEACMTGLAMYQLRASANCSGVYRGKEILVPQSKWSESLFDYVIFNNEGSL